MISEIERLDNKNKNMQSDKENRFVKKLNRFNFKRIYFTLIFVLLNVPLLTQAVPHSDPLPRELSIADLEYCIGQCIVTDDWKIYSDMKWDGLRHGEGFWIKLKLPDVHWEKPAVYIRGFFVKPEVFNYEERVYENGRGEYPAGSELANSYKYLTNHVIPLPRVSFSSDQDIPLEYLYFKIPCTTRNGRGTLKNIYIGSINDMILLAEKSTLDDLSIQIPLIILGSILFFVGSTSVIIFLFRWKEKDYPFLSFGLFSMGVGISFLSFTLFASVFEISQKNTMTISLCCMFGMPACMLAVCEQMFASFYKPILKRMWQFQVLFASIVVLWYQIDLIPIYLYKINTILSVIYTIFGILSFYKFARQPDSDQRVSKVIIAGCSVFALIISYNLFSHIIILFDFLPGIELVRLGGYSYGIGTFILVMSFGFALIDHYKNSIIKLDMQNGKIQHLEQINLHAKFEALKNQIKPHFLFNTLGTLIELIEENQSLAVDFVQELSNVYRYLLQIGDEKLVKVQQEIDFITSYTFLVSKRFGDNLNISISIEDSCMEKYIPPLSIQLLLENALKHNVISSKKPLNIDVFTEKGTYITLKNNFQRKRSYENSNKIGLANLIKRYQFYTKNKVIINSTETHFTVRIPLLKYPAEHTEPAEKSIMRYA